MVATWKDVSRLALSLPQAEEGATDGGNRAWTVRKKMFVWERPSSPTSRALACAPKRLVRDFLAERGEP